MVRIATVNDAEQLNILNDEFNSKGETSIDNIRISLVNNSKDEYGLEIFEKKTNSAIVREKSMIQEATERVRQMERYFIKLQKVVNTNPDALREDNSIKSILQILIQYYESGQWLQDYELDEKGLLPQDMKRGVLAQDSVYDFLDRIKNIGGWE